MASLAIGCLLTLGGHRACAQYGPYGGGGLGRPGYGGITNPPYSPYLNLLRPGGSTLQNYYGLVRPELDFRGGIGGLQQGLATTNQALGGLQYASGLLTTGHPTQFLNTGGYFLSSGTAGAGGGRGGAPRLGQAGGGQGGMPAPSGGVSGAGGMPSLPRAGR
jgi:hypothetical protein